MGMTKLKTLIPAVSVLLYHHRQALWCTTTHGWHVPLFLSNHDLQSTLWSPQMASLFLFWCLSFSFCTTFSFLSMPAKRVGVCGLQHVHSLPALPRAFWSPTACSVIQNMRWAGCEHSASFLIYINQHVNGAQTLFAWHNFLPSLACSSGTYIFLSLKIHLNTLCCRSPFFSSSLSFPSFPK